MNDVPDEVVALYYAQRASAGLLITEGMPVSEEGRGYLYTPGIYNDEHVQGWRKVTQAVHAKGGRIFAQLWHVGRMSHVSLQPGHIAPVSAGTVQAVNTTVFALTESGEPGPVVPSQPRALETHVGQKRDETVQRGNNARRQHNVFRFETVTILSLTPAAKDLIVFFVVDFSVAEYFSIQTVSDGLKNRLWCGKSHADQIGRASCRERV